MKVVFVNRFFHPDLAPTGRLASDVAFDLAAAGWEVHAVTSRLHYEGGDRTRPAEETVSGVHVHRVWSSRFGRQRLAWRMLDYASFYSSATARLLRLLREGDVVVAKTDPPLVSVCAALAGRLRGARLINWLEDVFPEVAQRVGLGFMGGPLGAAAKRLRDASVRSAAANVVVGFRMEREVRALVPGARLEVIANWSDGNEIRPMPFKASAFRREWGLGDLFVVGYSGNFGRAHECDTVVRAIELLRDEPGVVFSFTGGGYHFRRMTNLPNVVQRGYVAQERLSESLGASDLLLVTLLPQLEGLIVPSKLYAAMAAGRPALFVGDPGGEVGSVLREHGCGLSVAAGDARGLANAVLHLKAHPEECAAMGARARAAFKAHYDKPIGLMRWRNLLEKVAGSA